MKPFPLPVRAVGPGSHEEDETLEYMAMPQGMATFQAPVLPEPEDLAGLQAARDALMAVGAALDRRAAQGPAGGGTEIVSLDALDEANRRLINQVLGEGEVSAVIDGGGDPQAEGPRIDIQESVFAGVWRVLQTGADGRLHDHIEVGRVPRLLVEAGTRKPGQGDPAAALTPPPSGQPLPDGVMNAPAILSELQDQWRRWRPTQAPHVVNLTLLPLSPQDVEFLGERLGRGTVTVLSRGYGNCRVTSTAVPCCWQVVYYNSQDHVILHTLEITAMPDVVGAADEDLADSAERLREVLQWLETSD